MPRAKMAALAAKAFLAASHLSHVFASGQLKLSWHILALRLRQGVAQVVR